VFSWKLFYHWETCWWVCRNCSLFLSFTMHMCRVEAKNHGTKKWCKYYDVMEKLFTRWSLTIFWRRKTKKHRKPKIGLDVPQGRAVSQCWDEAVKITVVGRQKLQQMTCTTWWCILLKCLSKGRRLTSAWHTRRSAVSECTGVQWALDGRPHTCRHMAWRVLIMSRCVF